MNHIYTKKIIKQADCFPEGRNIQTAIQEIDIDFTEVQECETPILFLTSKRTNCVANWLSSIAVET